MYYPNFNILLMQFTFFQADETYYMVQFITLNMIVLYLSKVG